MPRLLSTSAVRWTLGVVMCSALLLPNLGWAQLGSNNPPDADLQAQRDIELESGFIVEVPPPGTVLRPVQRVPRERYGVVGGLPLGLGDLDALVYPDATPDEREALLEGLTFFTAPHAAQEGAGPLANQTSCQGCHLNSDETILGAGLLVDRVSNVSRAGRSSPTNFGFTSGDATTGGRAADHLDAIDDTGRTAAFTIFGDYSPSTNIFDPLDGSSSTIVFDPSTGMFLSDVSISEQQFGGFVQHTRPSILECLPDRLPTIEEDLNLGAIDPSTGLSESGFRRAVSERAGPPYIGRGLMEAIPNQDLVDQVDPDDAVGAASSLNSSTFDCTGDCITGRPNIIPERGGFVGLRPSESDLRAVGRFGLRANGVEMLQFVIGGLQGELGFTSLLNNNDLNFEASSALEIRDAWIRSSLTQRSSSPRRSVCETSCA
jgi:Di-haem oxidoreductase, putative peroxidase